METIESTSDEIDSTPPPQASAPPAKKKGPVPRIVAEAQEKDARTVVQWLREMGTAGKQMQLQLYRVKPVQYLGQDISGFIRRFDEEVDEEQIKAMFGGGKYQIKLNLPDDKGVFRFATAHSFEIAGPPKLVDEDGAAQRGKVEAREDSTVVKSVLETMSRQLDKAEDRATRGSNIDANAIANAVELATRPLYQTIDRLTTQLEVAQKAATDARNAPPDPVRDGLMNKLLTDDTSRMESVRMAHHAEVNTLRQSAIDLEARLRDKHERELVEIRSDHKTERERSERQHERELAEMKRSTDAQIADLKRSYETQIQILRDAHTREVSSLTTVNTVTGKVAEGDSKRLERENADLRAEVKTLREKKDKPLLEQLKEIDEIKEIIGAGGEEGEKKGYERVIEAVGNIPAIQKVIGKLAGAEGQQTGQPQLPPPHVPFVGQDGQMYTHDGQGNFMPVQRARRLRQVKRPAAPPPPPAPPPPDAPPEVQQQHAQQVEQHAKVVKEAQIAQAVQQIDRDQVAMAVSYLENAFRGNQDPTTVAQSLRSQGLVPTAVLQFLRDQGVDVLLEKVARLEASSPFTNQAGRNWIRKVAKVLIES
jgi:hypothetical protein